jgi:anti-sigma B factor antagonist
MATRESSHTAILTSGFETDDWLGHGYLSRVNKVPLLGRDQNMDVTVSEMRRVTLLEVSGRIDSTNATQFGDTLGSQIDAGRYQLVLDLSRVEYISSAGLREMVAALKKVKQFNGDLRIATPSERVREVMELAGLNSIFQVYPTQVEAVGSY